LTLEVRRPLTFQVFNPLTGGVVSNLTLMAGNRFALPQGPGAYILKGTFLQSNPPLPAASISPSIPAWFPKAPPLPPPQGEVIHVANVDELLAAIDRVRPGGTILLADGQYRMPRVIVLDQKKDMAIRSAAGDPTKVTLSGQGWDSHAPNDDLLHIGRCVGVTLADLTFADCRSYGVKVEAENAPKDIHLYNCHFRDIGVRALKGSAGQDPNIRAVKGSVRYCYFEDPASGNLALTPAATGAIDQGVSLPEVTDDIRRRPRIGRLDLGAWEFEGDTSIGEY
jgi:hypothetical protein